jgi:hypothetical protein
MFLILFLEEKKIIKQQIFFKNFYFDYFISFSLIFVIFFIYTVYIYFFYQIVVIQKR